jgi:hypothetical protein
MKANIHKIRKMMKGIIGQQECNGAKHDTSTGSGTGNGTGIGSSSGANKVLVQSTIWTDNK